MAGFCIRAQVCVSCLCTFCVAVPLQCPGATSPPSSRGTARAKGQQEERGAVFIRSPRPLEGGSSLRKVFFGSGVPCRGECRLPGGTGGPCVSCRQGLPEHLRRARLGTEARPRPAFLCGCSQQRLLPLASLAGLSGKLIGWPVTVAEEAAAIHSLPVARFPQRANGSSPPPPCPFPHTRPAAPQATAPLPARPLPRAALTCPAADLPGMPRARGGRPTVSDLPMGLHHSHPVLSWPLSSARNFVFCPPCPLLACSYHLPACWSIWWFPN